jgi:hypothetical protein
MLRFPNPSRSYDLTRRAVRFWGHDGAMEASFFVEAPALRIFQPKAVSEGELLAAFDCHRSDIHDAAEKSYKRGRLGSYLLTEQDF